MTAEPDIALGRLTPDFNDWDGLLSLIHEALPIWMA